MLIYLLIQLDHKLLHSTVSFLLRVRKAISFMESGGGAKNLNAALRGQTFWTCLEGELGFLTHCERGKKVQT